MLLERAFEGGFLRRLDRLIMAVRRLPPLHTAGSRTLGRVQGAGLELENYKDYAEGDDLRFLDWNALARLDELRVKTFRPERQIEVSLLIDASASMAARAEDLKSDLACALAAALAYVVVSSGDIVRVVAFAERGRVLSLEASAFKSRRESHPSLYPFMAGVRFEGPTRLEGAIERFMAERRPRGLVVLLSDFLVPPAQYEKAITRLTAAGHEVKVIHVLGRSEVEGILPSGVYRLRDSETGEVREVVLNDEVGAICRRRVAELSERLRSFCARNAITYVPAFGAERFEEILTRELPTMGLIR